MVFFHVVSLCSCFSSCTFFVANVWFVFDVLLFPFVFRFVVLLGGGGGYSFLHSSLQWSCTNDQKHDQTTENPQYLKFLFLMFCFGACTLTLSPGPHNNRNPKPSTLENRICLLHNALNPVLKCLFLQCFSNINQICPKHRPLTKMITLHNAQNQAECFRNGLLWKLKTFMLTKTHNWKKTTKNKKLREGIWKAKQKGNPKKTEIIDEKNLWNVIFSWNKRKETRQERTTKQQGRKNQQERKKQKNETRKK